MVSNAIGTFKRQKLKDNESLVCKNIFKPTLSDIVSPFDRPLTHKSFFNIVYFSLIPLRYDVCS